MDTGWEFMRRMRRVELGANWRKHLAEDYAARDKVRMPGEFDAATRQAAEFYRLQSQGEPGQAAAGKKYPDIATAVAAWRQPELRVAVQILVLANVPAAEICELLQVQEAILQVIENLYFDVRPMLTAAPWIVSKVINHEADAGRDDVAARLRAAYSYGPYVAKKLIQSKLRLPTEPAEQFADAAMLLHAKIVQATEMPLTSEQSIEFMKLAVEIRRDEKFLQLEREKLAFRMQRWAQRLELAQIQRSASPQNNERADEDRTAASAAAN